jgi:translation initiation factor 2-alpha kinase 4
MPPLQDLAQQGVPALCGVGLTMNVERLVGMAAQVRQLQNNAQATRKLSSADVLVCSYGGGGMLAERMAITAQLWAAGVSAETLPVLKPSTKQQYEYADLHGMRVLVTLRTGQLSTSQVVKVWELVFTGICLSAWCGMNHRCLLYRMGSLSH